ncbi:MAG: Zn-ribbon domain-containing OB-fold protein [Thaumarchaeota archaeon]|nr:Zn-ribbon domain-containing OB-fold protein [Nitrososphaerota archaeon]
MITVDSFYQFGRKGRLMGLECDSGHVIVPPRRSCPTCSSTTLEVRELSKKGAIISFTEVFVKSKEFPIDTPYVLALVQLVEGGRILGVVENPLDRKLALDLMVRIEFRKPNGNDAWPRIFFVVED